eukprot:TRINITY_DN2629_c0_g1_i1.p1 TRINITY_DN2629_c0_g1~~TRINITY_DN2629_c0_g1_i1.p1  ORF type:complete len:285 (+),score=13.30 TRINITY_DN2629_c0_g1_i1:434-1288(+)
MVKDSKYSKEGLLKFVHLMNSISDREELLDRAIDKGILELLLTSARVMQLGYDTKDIESAQYEPFTSLMITLLKNPKACEKIVQSPSLSNKMTDLISSHPSAGTISLVFLYNYARMVGDQSLSGKYKSELDSLGVSEHIEPILALGSKNNKLDLEIGKGAVAFTYMLFRWSLWNRFDIKHYGTKIVSKTVQSFVVYSIACAGLHVINNQIGNNIASSEQWKNSVDIISMLHLTFMGLCYAMMKRTPYTFLPFLASSIYTTGVDRYVRHYVSTPDEYFQTPLYKR